MDNLIQIEPASKREGCPIYTPGGAALEYAPWACNFYRFCGHKCRYCFVPAHSHVKRERFDLGAKLRPDWLASLRKDAEKFQALGYSEQILCCFMTDAYQPFNMTMTRPSLQILQEFGQSFCILTKGGSRALADIDLYRPALDCFASTLTSLDDKFSKTEVVPVVRTVFAFSLSGSSCFCF
jgi:DNA repair photolyase